VLSLDYVSWYGMHFIVVCHNHSHLHWSASGGACSDKGDAVVNGYVWRLRNYLYMDGWTAERMLMLARQYLYLSGVNDVSNETTNASIALHLAAPLVNSVLSS
jgi:hypothetical protein